MPYICCECPSLASISLCNQVDFRQLRLCFNLERFECDICLSGQADMGINILLYTCFTLYELLSLNCLLAYNSIMFVSFWTNILITFLKSTSYVIGIEKH